MPLLMYVEVLRMHCRTFLKSDSRESQHEVNNYCNDNYDPSSE